MASDDALYADTILNNSNEAQCHTITIASVQTHEGNSDDCRIDTFVATSDSNDGVEMAKTTKVLVHYGHFCDGEGCSGQPHFPIIGVRYECKSCRRAKYPHNLCHACYEKCPFKSDNSYSVSGNPLTFSSVNAKKRGESNVHAFDGKKPHHEFECISAPRTKVMHSEQLVETDSIDTRGKEKRIETIMLLNEDFDTVAFVTQVLVLYPVAFLIYVIRSKFPMRPGNYDVSSFLERILEAIDEKYQYYAMLPIVPIGLCWVANILAIYLVRASTQLDGKVMTAYWIIVYEVFFIHSVIAQVQLHLAGIKTSTLRFVISTITGASICSLGDQHSIKMDDVIPYVQYLRSINTAENGKMRFIFSSPLQLNNKYQQVDQEQAEVVLSTVDPAKVLLIGPRKHVDRSWTALVFVTIATGLVVFVAIINVIPSNMLLLTQVFTICLRIPLFEWYVIRNFTVNEACDMNIGNTSVNSSDVMARAFVNIKLYDIPTVNDGSPTLNMTFYATNDTFQTEIRFSMEEIWGASFIDSTSTSVNLQLLTDHDNIGMVLYFPDISCRSISNLQYRESWIFPEYVDNLENSVFKDDSQNIYVSTSFGFFILLPLLISFVRRGKRICAAMFRTWDYWDAFDSFTRVGKNEGIWVVDRQAKASIDFMQVENCHTWFAFRKLLIEVTSVNVRFAIPLLHTAVVQFVLSMTAICWYVVNGSAPIPGFLLLICLCSNSLATLLLLYPLHNIWIIQSSHVSLISGKYLQAEAIPLSDDHQASKRHRHVARLLNGIKIGLENCDERVSLLGFEVSNGFLWSLGTFAVSGISFFCSSQLRYYAYVD